MLSQSSLKHLIPKQHTPKKDILYCFDHCGADILNEHGRNKCSGGRPDIADIFLSLHNRYVRMKQFKSILFNSFATF